MPGTCIWRPVAWCRGLELIPPPATLLLGQSGGPTAVINASLAGAIEAGRVDQRVQRILGAQFGVRGIIERDFVDLAQLTLSELDQLASTPGAVLGSSRLRPSDQEVEAALESLGEIGVSWLSFIGGNDSADLMHRLHLAARSRGIPLNVVGIPKTVDNDLPEMDHVPGYGSAARTLAIAVRGSGADTAAMRHSDPVKVIEVPGRSSGWLAAAGALARAAASDAPHVLFFPERPRPLLQMVQEVKVPLDARGFAVVVISENQPDEGGQPLAGGDAVAVDPYGHAYFESPGLALVRAVRRELGVSARYERPSSILRSFSGAQSNTDLDEARAVGTEAVLRALRGESDVMVAIEREEGTGYRVRYGAVPLGAVASQERRLPDEFISANGIDITEAFLHYAHPLIGFPLPRPMTL